MDASTSIPADAIVYQDEQHVIAVRGNVVLSCSIDAPNPRFLEACSRTIDSLARQPSPPLLLLTIIDRQARAPDDAGKLAIRQTMLRHAAQIHAFAYVVEGEGFAAAAVRGALSIISLLARYSFPHKVFGRVEDAVPWMLSRPISSPESTPGADELIGLAKSLSKLVKPGA
jgi:hypothetical protein